mmetsp:Transcript_19662/g.45766  ORF Transcript_19662/g.45766 Transcript_19662/m.45766 type:complete len:325 (-) Transcript_19662:408-1382(-)
MLFLFHQPRTRPRHAPHRHMVVACQRPPARHGPVGRHFQLHRSVGHEIASLQGEHGIGNRNGRNAGKGIARYVAIHHTGIALFQIDSRMASGNATSSILVAAAIAHDIGQFNRRVTAGPAHVDARGGTIMDIGSLNGDRTAIDIDNAPTGSGGNVDTFQNSRGAGNRRNGTFIRTERGLNLNRRIAIPDINAARIVHHRHIDQLNRSLTDSNHGLVLTSSSKDQTSARWWIGSRQGRQLCGLRHHQLFFFQERIFQGFHFIHHNTNRSTRQHVSNGRCRALGCRGTGRFFLHYEFLLGCGGPGRWNLHRLHAHLGGRFHHNRFS